MSKVQDVQPVVSRRKATLRLSTARTAPQAAFNELDELDVAVMKLSLRLLPEVRQELVARVKAQITAGTYDTPQRLEAAIDAMLAEEFDGC